jgi:hypothetical protein
MYFSRSTSILAKHTLFGLYNCMSSRIRTQECKQSAHIIWPRLAIPRF